MSDVRAGSVVRTPTETAVVSVHLGLAQQSHGGREKAASVVSARVNDGVVKAAK